MYIFGLTFYSSALVMTVSAYRLIQFLLKKHLVCKYSLLSSDFGFDINTYNQNVNKIYLKCVVVK